jgi:hypothetical protein
MRRDGRTTQTGFDVSPDDQPFYPRFEDAIEGAEFVIYDREQPRGWLSAERPMEVRR